MCPKLPRRQQFNEQLAEDQLRFKEEQAIYLVRQQKYHMDRVLCERLKQEKQLKRLSEKQIKAQSRIAQFHLERVQVLQLAAKEKLEKLVKLESNKYVSYS